MCFWPCEVFGSTCELSLAADSGDCCLAVVCELLLAGASPCRGQALGRTGFDSCSTWIDSCGTQASSLHGMWDLPGPGIGPVSLGFGKQILNHWTTR